MVAGRPIWLDQLYAGELAALSPGMPARPELRPDVLVVGGGIVGVATALSCHRSGAGIVTLVESGDLGSGATAGAAGLVTPEPHHGVDNHQLVDLGRESLRRWRDLDASLPGGVGFVEMDWLGLEPHPEGFLADPPGTAEWLDAGEVCRLLPGLALEVAGSRIRAQGRVNPLRAVARLAGQLPQVMTGVAATAAEVRRGQLTSIETTAGRISPGAAIFATGGPPELDGLRLGVPADLVKGHLAATEPLDVSLPGSVSPLGVPIEDGRLLVGSTLDAGDTSPQVRPEVIERIRRELVMALPALAGARLTHRWCCWRPHHPDGLAVIDQVPGIENAWFTSGHYRTGVLLAPATGALLAEWITSGSRPSRARGWGLEGRFAPVEPPRRAEPDR